MSRVISKHTFIFFILLITLTNCIQLKKTQTQTKTISPYVLAKIAIKRIKDRIQYLNDTSCKVAAKFILLAISNIKDKSQLPILPLSGIVELDLAKIREKLEENYVLQIEIKANHHFIIFKKNDKDLYLLQAFQDRFKLRDWISNDKIMNSYLTIDEFFDKMRIMLNPDTPRATVDKLILEVFLPDIFTQDQELINSTLSYFSGIPVSLVNVNYVSFNFGVKYKDMRFRQLFHKVDYHYYIY
jgi:hypothetical protein